MATTTFSGPVKAGTIREGASANTGFVLMAQSAKIVLVRMVVQLLLQHYQRTAKFFKLL